MRESLKSNSEKVALLGDTEEVVEALGVTALVTQELSVKRTNPYSFDISKMTSFEAGTGPAIQYWYAKLSAILDANDKSNPTDISDEDFASIKDDKYVNLLRLLIHYPETTQSAYEAMEPATIMAYLVNVTTQLSLCIREARDVDHTTPVQTLLFEATKIVILSAMKILGINPSRR